MRRERQVPLVLKVQRVIKARKVLREVWLDRRGKAVRKDYQDHRDHQVSKRVARQP